MHLPIGTSYSLRSSCNFATVLIKVQKNQDMAAKVTITIILAIYSSCANGFCPIRAKENDRTVVLEYQRFSSGGLSDTAINNTINEYLDRRNDIGSIPENPAISCKTIAELRPSYESGYYWIQGASGAVKVYCEMGPNNTFGQSQTGGWMKIANVDMRNNHSQCPPGLVDYFTERRRLCRKPSLAPGCSSTVFSVQGVRYEKVCGKVIGYQHYQPYGFGPSRFTPGINQTYVDGVSLTHRSPRQHVWTFANATDETEPVANHYLHVTCPCLHPALTFIGVIPGFVGEDYYCETGSRREVEARYYFDDPLWDGEACEGENKCCDRGGPWFCKQLPEPAQDDIEMRVCTNSPGSDEDIVLEQIEL